MKMTPGKRLTLAAVTAFAMALPSFAADPAPTPVQNADFSITLPAGFAAFASQSQTAKQGEGTIQTTTYVSKAPTNEAIIVSVSKMPAKITDADKAFAGTRDSVLKSLNATLETEEKVAGDPPADRLLFKTTTANPVFCQSRLTAKDDRLYQLLYVGRSEEQRKAPAVAALFDSFHIADAPPATASAK